MVELKETTDWDETRDAYIKRTLSYILLDKDLQNLEKSTKIYWLKIAIDYNDFNVVNLILDNLGIPNNMSVKERIAYYQLLGGANAND